MGEIVFPIGSYICSSKIVYRDSISDVGRAKGTDSRDNCHLHD